ncbi:MAG TPA: hypothetical protein VGF59_27585 [Bryobacteraceae bacterium]|jgi:hypothetical protein
MTYREQAEELRLSLAMGLIEKADVIRWADAIVLAEANPPTWIFDVSLASNEPPGAVANRLRDVADGIDVTVPAQKALERLARAFRSGKLAPLEAAQKLILWANSAQLPCETRAEAFDVMFIAEDVADGIYGSLADVSSAIERFLTRHEAAWRTG